MVADVLESARNGALKTHIMYSSNLSYSSLNDLLETLTENGMIREECDSEGKFPSMSKYFVTTDKGYRFLEQFKELYDLMNSPSTKK